MIRAALICLALVTAACTPTEPGDPVIMVRNNDAGMNAAIARAQSTLPLFIANALDKKGRGGLNADVKVAMPTISGGLENIWTGNLRNAKNGQYAGQLLNAPVDLGPLRRGDVILFTPAMITDWSFVGTDGRLYGNYTTRVTLDFMDPDTATRLGAQLSTNPVPADWRR